MKYDAQYLIELVAKDSRDMAILEELRVAISYGRAPKEIWGNICRSTGLKYHHISRSIKKMNKLMEKEMGEHIADKVGRNWALSRLMLQDGFEKMIQVRESSA